jgi:hypothetical protein
VSTGEQQRRVGSLPDSDTRHPGRPDDNHRNTADNWPQAGDPTRVSRVLEARAKGQVPTVQMAPLRRRVSRMGHEPLARVRRSRQGGKPTQLL